MIDGKNGDNMPNNTANCSLCPFNPQNNVANLHSKNMSYIWKTKNNGPLMLENNNSDILLVFEAPGIDEWSKRQPIISKRGFSAARKFDDALKTAGKARVNYDITEAVLCFPGKSTAGVNQKIQEEVETAATYCQQYLQQDILNNNYRKIICFGEIAYSSVLKIYPSICADKPYYSSLYPNRILHLTHPICNKNLQQDIITYL